MPMISVEHAGKIVHAIFNKREEYLGTCDIFGCDMKGYSLKLLLKVNNDQINI